jgi:hypothetical protein
VNTEVVQVKRDTLIDDDVNDPALPVYNRRAIRSEPDPAG